MTHTTPYHHLMEEDHVPVNAQKKDDGKKHDIKIKSDQKNFSKVYKDESKKFKKGSEIIGESQSEESKDEEVDNNENEFEKQQQNSSSKTKGRTEQQLIVRKSDELKQNKNALPTRRDIEKKNFINIKQSQRNLPVAKAYEGSDSGEEIDTLVLNERYKESAASSNRNNRIQPLELQQQSSINQILRNHGSKSRSKIHDELIEEFSNNDSQNSELLSNHSNHKYVKQNGNKERTPHLVASKKLMKKGNNENIESIDDDESTLNSDVSSVIYREKPVKASKR